MASSLSSYIFLCWKIAYREKKIKKKIKRKGFSFWLTQIYLIIFCAINIKWIAVSAGSWKPASFRAVAVPTPSGRGNLCGKQQLSDEVHNMFIGNTAPYEACPVMYFNIGKYFSHLHHQLKELTRVSEIITLVLCPFATGWYPCYSLNLQLFEHLALSTELMWIRI